MLIQRLFFIYTSVITYTNVFTCKYIFMRIKKNDEWFEENYEDCVIGYFVIKKWKFKEVLLNVFWVNIGFR